MSDVRDISEGYENHEPQSSMLDYKLYEIAPAIAEIIRNNVNQETGEINEGAVEEIIALEEHAEVKIHNCGQVLRRAYKNTSDIDEQIKKLRADKARILREATNLEKYLIRCSEILNIDKVIMDGKTTEIKMSRESVVGDVEKCDPEYVVVKESRSLDKRAIMRVWKAEKINVEGTEIVRRKIVKV